MVTVSIEYNTLTTNKQSLHTMNSESACKQRAMTSEWTWTYVLTYRYCSTASPYRIYILRYEALPHCQIDFFTFYSTGIIELGGPMKAVTPASRLSCCPIQTLFAELILILIEKRPKIKRNLLKLTLFSIINYS